MGDGPNGAALFEAANKLRGSVESAEYKHLVLGRSLHARSASERAEVFSSGSPRSPSFLPHTATCRDGAVRRAP
jgi:hypothetical protein